MSGPPGRTHSGAEGRQKLSVEQSPPSRAHPPPAPGARSGRRSRVIAAPDQHAAYLAALPADVAGSLARMVRVMVDTTDEEKILGA